MSHLFNDSRFRLIIFANIASSIGSGITMIAIPWLLVSSNNGNEIFGYVTIGMTILSFLITPYIGSLIDSISRKKLLIVSKVVCVILLFLFSLIGFLGIRYEVWHYIIIYMIGNLYYTIFYPTMFALNQEIFNKGQYKALNGTMEVQGQLSSMIAGAVASILLLKWDLQFILLLDVFTYTLAIYFYLKLPYAKTGIRKTRKLPATDILGGFSFMLKHASMFMFLCASLMPFIGVMITNYLFPVYLSDVLKTDGNIYGIQGMIYGLGAIVAGVFVPILAKKIGDEKTIVYGVLTYTLAISLVLYTDIPGYLSLMFFIAIGNSGARVARNSFLMDHIPNEIMGRIDSLFRSIGLLMRIILLAVFTGLVSSGQITLCFLVLGGLLLLASVFVIFTWKKGFIFNPNP